MKRDSLRTRLMTWPVPAALCLALVLANPAGAQDAADDVPRMADGRPDLSGVWWGGGDVGSPAFAQRLRQGRGGEPPPTFTDLYQPWEAERASQMSDENDPALDCIPTAFATLNVRLWDAGAVGQIIATPEMVVLLSETYHGYQLVPTDGRPHRNYVPPSYRGDAVGHWEGDVFVVEVKNFTDRTWITAQGRVSFHSDALRVVERYRRVDADTLVVDAVVEDPNVLTEPWTVPTQTLQLAPFDQLLPLNCVGAESKELMEAAAPIRSR